MQQWGHAPTQANNLKKRLRTLFHLAIFMGWRETDPIVGVKNLPHKRKGFHTWTDDEITRFEAFYASRHQGPAGVFNYALYRSPPL